MEKYVKIKMKCPVCGRQIYIEAPPVDGLREFVVLHGDHAAKIYIDEDHFVRRAWPASLLKAEEPFEETFGIFVGRGKAVVLGPSGEKLAEAPAEELGAAIALVEKLRKEL